MFQFANIDLFGAVTDADREFSKQDMNVEPKETVNSQVATAHASTSDGISPPQSKSLERKQFR